MAGQNMNMEQINDRYDQIVAAFIGMVGQDQFDRIVENMYRQARAAKSDLASNYGANFIKPEYEDEERHLRELQALGQGLNEQDKARFDAIYRAERALMDDLEKLDMKENVLGAIGVYMETKVKDYRAPQEVQNQVRQLDDDINDLLGDMNWVQTERMGARTYGRIMMDAMTGKGPKDVVGSRQDAHGREEWLKYAKQRGVYGAEEGAAEQELEAMENQVLQAQLAEPDRVIMDIQAYAPKFGEAFAECVRNREFNGLSDMDRRIAAQNFDQVMDRLFSDDQKEQMKAQGKDLLDFVYVDGISVNELYAEAYGNREYYGALEYMKCELLADALNGKQVDICIPEKNGLKVLPLEVHSSVPGLQERQMNQEALNRKGLQERTARIRESLERQDQRSEKEIRDRRMRMIHDTPPVDGNFEPLQSSRVVDYKPVFRSKDRHDKYLNMRIPEGKAVKLSKDRASGYDLYSVSNRFSEITTELGYTSQQMEFFRSVGVEQLSELFYIDGQPAADYVKKLYPKQECDDMVVQAEIVSAMLSGAHHVEAATLGVDENGVYKASVNQVKADLSDFDRKAKFYQTKPSEKQNKLLADDKDKEARHDKICAHFSQKIAAGMVRKMNEKERTALEKELTSYQQLLEDQADRQHEPSKRKEGKEHAKQVKAQNERDAKGKMNKK